MTIAACYLSMEGVVFGADSTTTIPVQGPTGVADSHYFDHGQKIYQVGRDSQLGVAIWGLGSFGQATSYRTLIAEVGDALEGLKSVEEVAIALGARVWAAFESMFGELTRQVRALESQASRTAEEEDVLRKFKHFGGGFCVGGCVPPSRAPSAFEVSFECFAGVSSPTKLAVGRPKFWGAPNVVDRLIFGIDFDIFDSIMESGKWTGTEDELIKMVADRRFHQPTDLPLREAVDWVYASVFATIKAFKFSHLDPICGGPVELAVISTDRPFRWVRHKNFDTAI